MAVQHFGGFPEGLEELFPHGSLRVHIKFLLQIGDPGFPLTHHLAGRWFLEAGNEAHLGGFASTVHAHQANAIAWLDLPGHIFQHLSRGVDLADALQSQHRCGGMRPTSSRAEGAMQTGLRENGAPRPCGDWNR